ncbi:hypothetical protein [Nocardia sp. NPDC051570]|uniref:hypothetical protein n=1 Tax=Nocardia sp. NPDC051570 TaxID=3364324 RepID=UPI00379FBB5F
MNSGERKIREVWTWSGAAWAKVYASMPPFGFVDEFDTDTNTGIGSAWTVVSQTGAAKGRVAQGHAMVGATTAAFSPVREAVWFRPTDVVAPQDGVAIRFRLTNPTPYNAANNNDTVVALRATNDDSNRDWIGVVCFGGTALKAQIYTCVGGTTTPQGPVGALPMNVDLEIKAVGRSFTLIRLDTGATVTSWFDDSNVTYMDADHRAFKVAFSGNCPSFQGQYNSPGLDRFEARLPENQSVV